MKIFYKSGIEHKADAPFFSEDCGGFSNNYTLRKRQYYAEQYKFSHDGDLLISAGTYFTGIYVEPFREWFDLLPMEEQLP